tara:strand:- start:258 stop:653 length:396 start_codon:yes stop_codon:yes gene_type:complete
MAEIDIMATVHDLTLEQLDKINNQEVAALSDKVMVVMFYAPWCGHCTAMKPEMDKVASQTNSKTCVCKMNCDENENATKKFGISGFPTTIVFDKGVEKKRMEGRMDCDGVMKKLSPEQKGGRHSVLFYPSR